MDASSDEIAGTVDQVLRVLHGENPHRVAEECGVPLETVLDWEVIFVRAGARALAEHLAEPDARAAGAGTPLDTGTDDGPQLDWCLDEERLGNMITTLGAMMLEQTEAES